MTSHVHPPQTLGLVWGITSFLSLSTSAGSLKLGLNPNGKPFHCPYPSCMRSNSKTSFCRGGSHFCGCKSLPRCSPDSLPIANRGNIHPLWGHEIWASPFGESTSQSVQRLQCCVPGYHLLQCQVHVSPSGKHPALELYSEGCPGPVAQALTHYSHATSLLLRRSIQKHCLGSRKALACF